MPGAFGPGSHRVTVGMLLRRLARPLLAAIFIQGGIAAWRDPKGHAELAAPVIDRVTGIAPIDEPPSNLTLVQVDAGVKIGAGVLLAFGKAPRLSAAALAASLVPTTIAAHRFWEIDDPTQRTDQQVHFFKNLGLLGGLLLASADTHGKPSLAWRARHAGRTSAATAELLHRDITGGLGQLSERAGHLTGELTEVANRAGGQAADVASRAGERLAPAASRAGERAADAATRAGGRVAPAAARAGDRVADVATRAGERVGVRAELLLGEADMAGSKAAKRARKIGRRARKRTEQRLEVASKELSRAGRRASKRLEKLSDEASKTSSRQLRKASAKARETQARVERKLA